MFAVPLAGVVLLAARVNYIWYALPLVVAVSLVYSATRHETIQPIVWGAVRIGAWICGFMLVVFLILQLLSWFV